MGMAVDFGWLIIGSDAADWGSTKMTSSYKNKTQISNRNTTNLKLKEKRFYSFGSSCALFLIVLDLFKVCYIRNIS